MNPVRVDHELSAIQAKGILLEQLRKKSKEFSVASEEEHNVHTKRVISNIYYG